MKKGYQVTLGVLTIMILLTLTVGTSYSYYTVGGTQDDTNDLVTTCFKIDYNGTDDININNAYPMSDTKGEASTPYSFTVTNTCTAANAGTNRINYEISLNTVKNKTSNLAGSLKYKLDTQASTLLSTKLNSSNSLKASLKEENGVANSYGLTSGSLGPGETKTFNLRLWIDENAGNEVMGQTFYGKVLVYAYM